MSLQTRLTDLVAAIGADIKNLTNRPGETHNASLTDQTGFATDTYLAGSQVVIPQGKIKAGTKYNCKFNVVKTAAGGVAPTIRVRVGTTGTTADAAQVLITFASQTGAADEGEFEVELVFRQAGATALIQSFSRLTHRLLTSGLNIIGANTFVLAISAPFDVTGAGLNLGLSVNAGTASAWTISLVRAELSNLTP